MKFLILLAFAFGLFSTSITSELYADETVSEKAAVMANDAKRAAKKAANRVTEKLCDDGDLKCAAEKAKNRVIEVKDSTVDAVKKAKNIVD